MTVNKGSSPPLTSLYINPTMRCNLLCRHCWVSSASEKAIREKQDEMSAGEIIGILEVAEGLGLKTLKFTGGEPLLRDDLEPVLAFCASRGIATWIETNGTFITAGTAKILREHNVGHISVSLDSWREERHDFLRGKKGAFKRTVRGIECLVNENFPVQVIMSLYRENLNNFELFLEFVEGLGVSSIKINVISGIDKGEEIISRGEGPTVQEVLEFSGPVDEISRRAGVSIYLDIPMAFKELYDIKFSKCGRCAVKSILGILPDGGVSLCGVGSVDENIVFGNVRREPEKLRDIWETHPVVNDIRQNLPGKLEGVCSLCIFKGSCLGGCRAEVFYSGGKIASSPSPFCQEAYEKGLFPSTRLIAENLRV